MRAGAVIVIAALAASPACRARNNAALVSVENPFLVATVESFRQAAREAVLKNDVSSLANHVFVLKRTLPLAWASVVNSTGSVLMHSDPRAIATEVAGEADAVSMAYADATRPLVRRLLSPDHRPVLDLTLPLSPRTSDRPTGYIRVGFFTGERAPRWSAPPGADER